MIIRYLKKSINILIFIVVLLSFAIGIYFYPKFPVLQRSLRREVCHIDEEPYNLATYLALRAAKAVGARAVLFTWQNLARPYPPPFRQFEGYAYRHADAIIAGNRDAIAVLRAKGYQGLVRLIPQFGVDPQLFCPTEAPHQDPCVIGYAGRLVEQKGLLTLAEALADLPGRWQLVLYGTGPLEEELRARFAVLGLAERVRFAGRVSSLEMPQCLAQMDVLVLPSLTRPNWKEQFGRILVEAMACGVPVIGSSSGEIPNVIGDAGLVFPEGDATALRAALGQLLGDASLRGELGRRGRQRVLAHYTQAHIAAETAALYRDVLRGTLA